LNFESKVAFERTIHIYFHAGSLDEAALPKTGGVMKKFVFTTIVAGATVCSSIGIMFLGCSTDPIGAEGTGGTGNSGGPSGSAGAVIINLDGSLSGLGGEGGSGLAPTEDANCGSQTAGTTQVPADVLLVLDRSGSMDESMSEDCYCDPAKAWGGDACANASNCTTRWQSLTSGLNTTLTSTPGIRWGLKFFSSPNSSGFNNGCAVNSGVEVQIGANNSATAIQTQIARVSPGNSTPTAAAIAAATKYLDGVSDPNNKVILLATDGEPNCINGDSNNSESDVPGTKNAIKAALTAGFKVYVIGIGPSVGNLDDFAQAGGTTNYYPATSPQDLAEALAAISQVVASCTFTLSQTPKDPNNLAVYLDTNLVPNTGWSYTASSQTVELNGSYCDAIKKGTATTVQVYFGCGETPPPIIK
jgi:hypothetical protein